MWPVVPFEVGYYIKVQVQFSQNNLCKECFEILILVYNKSSTFDLNIKR